MNVDNLLEMIEDARHKFQAAVETSDATWERRPEAAVWTPREIAEHVMGAELGYAGAVASALGLARPAWETFELRSAPEALRTHHRVAAISRAIMSRVSDADLARRTPSDATVLDALEKASNHLIEHAGQLRAQQNE